MFDQAIDDALATTDPDDDPRGVRPCRGARPRRGAGHPALATTSSGSSPRTGLLGRPGERARDHPDGRTGVGPANEPRRSAPGDDLDDLRAGRRGRCVAGRTGRRGGSGDVRDADGDIVLGESIEFEQPVELSSRLEPGRAPAPDPGQRRARRHRVSRRSGRGPATCRTRSTSRTATSSRTRRSPPSGG